MAAHLPAVRSALLFRQRAFARSAGARWGRKDVASVVFPRPSSKVFLTASAEVRAERRYKRLLAAGAMADRGASWPT